MDSTQNLKMRLRILEGQLAQQYLRIDQIERDPKAKDDSEMRRATEESIRSQVAAIERIFAIEHAPNYCRVRGGLN